jgi:hypothetical protein
MEEVIRISPLIKRNGKRTRRSGRLSSAAGSHRPLPRDALKYSTHHSASSNYAKSAAGIYRTLGEQELQRGVLGAAESYFKKAIGCAKHY